jgi:hypothetical protein
MRAGRLRLRMGYLLHEDDAEQRRGWLDGAAQEQGEACQKHGEDAHEAQYVKLPCAAAMDFLAVARGRRWRMGYTVGTWPEGCAAFSSVV